MGSFDGFVGLFVLVGCEGDVLGRVPVLGEYDVVELFCEGVDERDDCITICDGQCAAGHEVVLDVDDEERVVEDWSDGHALYFYATG
jgi:hypothetical protein